MAVQQTHQDNISISITQAALALTDAKFTTVLYMRDGISLDGADVVTYTSTVAAQADLDAGFIDATTMAAVTAAFLQQKKPKQFKVGRVNVAAPETYLDALNRILITDCDFWAIVTDLRVPATTAAFIVGVEALANNSDGFRGAVIFQDDDVAWKTASIPVAFATIDGLLRWAVIYNDTDAEIDDVRWAVARAAFDPDEKSAPWDGRITGGLNSLTDPTDAEKGFLDGNFANHALPFGNVPRWVDGGWMGNGSFVYEQLTVDWYHVRFMQDVITQKTRYSDRGRKWSIDDVGRAVFRGLIEGRLAKGVQAEHFQEGQTKGSTEPVSTTDLSLGRIRGSGEATFLTSARLFQATLVFGRDLVNVVE